MGDVSNKTLVGLLVVAILVSLVGTFVSLDKLGSLGGVAGAASTGSGTGVSSINVTGYVAITVQNNVSFGQIVVNDSTTGVDTCNMAADVNGNGSAFANNAFTDPGYQGTPWENDTIWDGCLNTSGTALTDSIRNVPGLIVENTGTTLIDSLSVNSSQGEAGFNTTLGISSNGAYNMSLAEEIGITNGLGSCASTPNYGSDEVVRTTDLTICTNMSSSNENDAIIMGIHFLVPDNANLGQFSDTLTFTATTT